MLKPSSTLPPITFGVYQADYLALGRKHDRGDKRKVMSNGELKKFARCPSKWKRGSFEESSDAQEWGNLVDCLVLTPERFEEQYVICPEEYPAAGKKKGDPVEMKSWNWNAGYCKEWRAKQEAVGKVCVKADWASEGHAAKARLMADPILREFVQASQSQVQLCVDWHDEGTGLIIPVKCLLDLLPSKESRFSLMLGDLKTACNGSPGPWAKQVFEKGYHIQAALYLDAYNVVTREKRNQFVHVVQESESPYETARRILSEEYLQIGRATYQRALVDYCYCLANDVWPGLDEADGMGSIIDGWRLTEPEAWMILV